MKGAELVGREQLVQNISSYLQNLQDALVQAAEIVQAKVVVFAQQRHPYTDRTTNLTKSIQPGAILLTKDAVEAEIKAGDKFAPYASYVEFGTSRSKPYPFLFPALMAHREEFRRRVANAFKENRP